MEDCEVQENALTGSDAMLAAGKIVEAGIWLIRNGYGRLMMLPYASASGKQWRCEFHLPGAPERSFYRYSSEYGFNYLSGHDAGTNLRNVSPMKLAQNILTRIPTEAKIACAGEASAEMLTWLVELEDRIHSGFLPEAFHEYTKDYSYWRCISYIRSEGPNLSCQPGYVFPGIGTNQSSEQAVTRSISMAPSADLVVKRACRLLAAVHELHKAGYQQLRISAGWSADGAAWRCRLSAASRTALDGWRPLDEGPEYASTQGKAYFGWTDCGSYDARTLAQKIVDRLPELAETCAGNDWAYAGWFTEILGRAECGVLPAFYANGFIVSRGQDATPLPPVSVVQSADMGDPTGSKLIANEDLKLSDLPHRDASEEDVIPFCASYDGYAGFRTVQDCIFIADRAEREGLEYADMDVLRITAFIRQRAIKWTSDFEPADPKYLISILSVIREIRRRLEMNL